MKLKLKEKLQKRVRQLKLESKERKALEYLIKHALGAKNALSIKSIVTALAKEGIQMSEKRFAQDVLARSRKKDYFIGSCTRGVFVILDEEDYKIAHDFYESKVGAMRNNLGNLEQVGLSAGCELTYGGLSS